MFDRAFQWFLRHGPRVLFALAGLVGVVSFLHALLVGVTTSIGRLHSSVGFPHLLWFGASGLQAALSNMVTPLLGALLINRLDRWLDSREKLDPPRTPTV